VEFYLQLDDSLFSQRDVVFLDVAVDGELLGRLVIEVSSEIYLFIAVVSYGTCML